jgi:AsmA family protein
VSGPARVTGLALDGGGDALSGVLDAAMPGRRREPYVDVQCVVVRLPVRDGLATAERTIAYETSKVNMAAAGTINFRTEALDLAIRPTVKEGLGIGAMTLAELVKVTGTLAEPSIGLDTLGSAKAALSVGGAVLTGGLSLLGQGLLSRAGDPAPCKTALGVSATAPPAKSDASREDDGLLGSIRRLFK